VVRRGVWVLDLALLCFAPIISCNCLADGVEARKETIFCCLQIIVIHLSCQDIALSPVVCVGMK